MSNLSTEQEVTKGEMETFAKHIEEYLDLFMEVFIIPDNLRDKEEEVFHAIKTVKKLIEKLNKHDASVFKDYDEWESIED